MITKNKKYSFRLFLFFTFAGISNLSAQLNINLPAERSVFQRDNNNRGTIVVSGNLTGNADRVEARLIPVTFGQGSGTDWIAVDTQIDGFSFTGKIESTGGWYSLEVRSLRNNQVVETSSVKKVGIGEVFVIAGQSNAQGYGANPRALGASDDRVNAYSYLNTQFLNEVVPENTFAQIQSNLSIGPRGHTPWCWGELGDRLVRKLNVPVMFFNTAYSGTTIENWVSSMRGIPTVHKYDGTLLPGGTPYSNLRIILQNCVSLYGIRAVLWHQGEADAQTPESTYTESLKAIIAETRKNTGKNINWVVSRASLDNNQTSPAIIRAQNAVINSTSMVFEGPSTDNIQYPRPDGVHFENNSSVSGLSLLASAWDLSLSTSFFSNSSPFKGSELLEIQFRCNNDNLATISLDRTFASVQWQAESGSLTTSPTLQVSQGGYLAVARDQVGNCIFSNFIRIRDVYPKSAPVVTPTISATACVGNAVELKSTTATDLNLIWNTGETSATISSRESKVYYSQFKNRYECTSSSSNQVRTQFVNPPGKPNLEFVNNIDAVCEGGKVEVRVTNPSNFSVVWSTGETSNPAVFTKTPANGTFATLYSNHDCPSVPSETIRPLIQPVPAPPSLSQSGPYSLEAISQDGSSLFDWYLEGNFFSRTSKDIFLDKSGFYTVAAIKTYPLSSGRTLDCRSRLSSIFSFIRNSEVSGIVVYANPVIDGSFRVTSDTPLINVTARLYTMDGKTVIDQVIPELKAPVTFKLNTYKSGSIYMLNLKHNDGEKSYRLFFE